MTAPTSLLSRRAALGLAVAGPAGVLLSACSGSAVTDRLDAGVDRLEAPRSTPPAPANPDQPIVDAAAAAIAGLRATLLPHRAQDPLIGQLAHLHARHLHTLGASSARGTATPLGAGSVRAQVIAQEKALAALLAAKAGVAHDGQLARLLASMSAAVSQRIAGEPA